MKILIIGSPGSGKSQFSKELSLKLNIPAYHLDDFYWFKNWERPTEKEWRLSLNALLNQKTWIIDGNYYSSLPLRISKADIVIYFDYLTLLCLFRALKRALHRRYFSKESLPLKIREDKEYKSKLKINFKFILLILTFKAKYKEKIITLLKNNATRYFFVKATKDESHIMKAIISENAILNNKI